MIKCNPGDVILIPFPFTDLSSHKKRPALIVSSKEFSAHQLDVIVMAVTSQIPKPIPATDYLLSPAEQAQSGLPKASLIKTGKIVTIDKRLIRQRLGRISPEALLRILDVFKRNVLVDL